MHKFFHLCCYVSKCLGPWMRTLVKSGSLTLSPNLVVNTDLTEEPCSSNHGLRHQGNDSQSSVVIICFMPSYDPSIWSPWCFVMFRSLLDSGHQTSTESCLIVMFAKELGILWVEQLQWLQPHSSLSCQLMPGLGENMTFCGELSPCFTFC